MQPHWVYAVKLVLQARGMKEYPLSPMGAAGLSGHAIVDANQLAAYFNCVNRISDGLGVERDP
jgi:hypothetical protein